MGGGEKGLQNFGRKITRKYCLRFVGVYDKITLKWVFKNGLD
jgi:hypothetical protein